MDKRPVGVFDSGVGGLTVAHALKQLMPGENLVYFGDTAHLPYGDKSEEAIRQYSEKIIEYLLSLDAKAILVACNSASASAYNYLVSEFDGKVIIMDVITPVIEYVVSRQYKKIGVIGTKRTISSGVYPGSITEKSPGTTVVSLATPMLVPMIEEGFIYDDISNRIISAYLSNEIFEGIEALILGCTHYPIIRNQISRFFNFNVEIIDSSKIVAAAFRNLLESHNILNTGNNGTDRFFVSDYTDFFGKIARMFFEKEINLVKSDIWAT
ncbi:MAG TPA: glutamate racemase [Bacteroidales bacterium]|nr:glutamate racemase [Bacteroidales bacterium]